MRSIFLLYVLTFGFVFNSCTQNHSINMNHLANETSPYLLQHVNNPVDWYPWGEEALERAKKENKLIIISIGYSACHWCHVMEKESFEDREVAKIMNDNFICIKVDREERPDVDQVYMNAVHIMRQRGGWPLNCIALPDGKPIWGGTYFRKKDWIAEIQKISNFYHNNPDIAYEYGEKITQGIATSELVNKNIDTTKLSKTLLNNYYTQWSTQFDMKNGGRMGAPKFPLPNNYEFLLNYGVLSKKNNIVDYVLLTLNKMSDGGIYDQIGGGFCRYSTDKYWKVPHFEKMLYDNAQLVSLYSSAYTLCKNSRFKAIVYQTLDFIERELYDKSSGAFYSSLDADSEGVEGKFYVWEKDKLKKILGENYSICETYYNVNKYGLWDEKYILLKKNSDDIVAKHHNINLKTLSNKISNINTLLFNERSKRIRPGLDDKSLTSWNGLMLKGYIDAYKAFGDDKFLKIALKNGEFILKNQKKKDGGLFHSYKKGESSINGFLEDYAFIIEAFIALYEASFEEKWLDEANKLMEYSLNHFFDQNSGMFFFTSDLDNPLIVRKFEITDNVIPASNSSIAKSLFILGHIFSQKKYLETSQQMLQNVKQDITKYGPGYSNWSTLILYNTFPFYEIAVIGDKSKDLQKELLTNHYLPNKIIVGSNKNSDIPILKNKFRKDETQIYVCENGACQQPTSKIEDAVLQITY